MHQHMYERAPLLFTPSISAPPIYTGNSISMYTPTDTASAASASYTGDPTYFVFPNPEYISRFYMVSSQYSGLTHQDIDLFNRCCLPYNPLPYIQSYSGSGSISSSGSNAKREKSWVSITIEKPDYQKEQAPCKRQAAINANCHFKNTNGTFPGLLEYTDHFEEQQHCYCEKYPFFDSVMGCQKCFEMHGGIEGYHWYPESYINAVADAYCNADPLTKEFYLFVNEWKATATEANVPSTTARDILGTQTAASLYYTPRTARSNVKSGLAMNSGDMTRNWRVIILICAISSIIFGV